MKNILAVAMLLMAFACTAFADGPDLPPTKAITPITMGTVQLADGPDLPPTKATARTGNAAA
jgi:hypothetical protein